MSDIKLGIIGAGYIAREHLKVIQDIAGISVVGITSRTISKAKELSNDYQIEHVCNNVYELIEKCAIDALLVFVSADQVFTVTEKLIPQQIPLFIEKPSGLVPEETYTLFKLADENGTKNMVALFSMLPLTNIVLLLPAIYRLFSNTNTGFDITSMKKPKI